MAQQSFTAQIDAWVLQSKTRMLAVFQTAAQFVIEDMLDRTPVDTGYLRASVTVRFNKPAPIRPNNVPMEGAQYGMPTQYALAIAGAKLGKTIYASYTAAYALPIEYGFKSYAGAGMVRLAAQNWGAYVTKATAMARAKALK
ncbi:MAG: HK97 gp10 family phage protein [Bartonella sp.]|nr:HK97 gp10 family phage protein [Bartonella sp.]